METTNNTIAISDRRLMVTCTTISILSFFGILFLVVVVSIVVSKAVQLALGYQKFKNEAQERTQDFIGSDGFKNFQDHLVEATQNVLGSSKRIVQNNVPGVAKEEQDPGPNGTNHYGGLVSQGSYQY